MKINIGAILVLVILVLLAIFLYQRVRPASTKGST
jgi:hypothetical protein